MYEPILLPQDIFGATEWARYEESPASREYLLLPSIPLCGMTGGIINHTISFKLIVLTVNY